MCEYIECVFIEMIYRAHKMIVGVVYRPPNSNIAHFNDAIHDILEKVANRPCYIIFLDMNCIDQQRNFLISCMPILISLW